MLLMVCRKWWIINYFLSSFILFFLWFLDRSERNARKKQINTMCLNSNIHTYIQNTVCHSETTGQIFRGITPILCLTICPLAHRTYPMRLSLYNKFLSSLSSFLKLINHFEDTKSEGIEKLNIYHKSRLIFWLYLGSFSSLFPCTVMQITGNNKELHALTNSQIKMSDFC